MDKSYCTNNFYIITGGPGSGKTTLLKALRTKGYRCISETARKIIKEQMEENGEALPWKNKLLYTELMFKNSVESYLKIYNSYNETSPVFFDRGILDSICYADMSGIEISEQMDKIARQYPYNKKVFLLPPWKEIYQTDSERKQIWQEAVFTYKKMKETYLKYDYHIIEVPVCSIEERIELIISQNLS